jgi:hypothetical protein
MPRQGKNSDLLRYAGLGTQLLVALGIAVYLGRLVDSNWIRSTIPIATVLFPLVVLFAIIYSLVRQTSKRRNDDPKEPV